MIKSTDPAPYTTTATQPSTPDNDDIIAQAIRILEARNRLGATLTTPNNNVINQLRLQHGEDSRERMIVITLTAGLELIQMTTLHVGTIDTCQVSPREVIRLALEHNAAAIILAHNHPSGGVDPSTTDVQSTRDVKKACELFKIRLVDHIIFSTRGSFSMQQQGMIEG